MRKQFQHQAFAEFPPKKMFSLTGKEVAERRVGLERYFQQIGQDPVISASQDFKTFLLNAQEEVKLACEQVELTIYLVNKKSITIGALSTDQTDEVLEQVCEEIGIDEDLTYYFGLFLVKEDGKRFSIIRPLQDFECPYVSLDRLVRCFFEPNWWKTYDQDQVVIIIIHNLTQESGSNREIYLGCDKNPGCKFVTFWIRPQGTWASMLQ